MKTSELTGAALDWAVAKCEGLDVSVMEACVFLWIGKDSNIDYEPSTDWAQGGPIIEREKIECLYDGVSQWYVDAPHGWYEGPHPLKAAMRCYVASKFGDEVEIPSELMEGEKA